MSAKKDTDVWAHFGEGGALSVDVVSRSEAEELSVRVAQLEDELAQAHASVSELLADREESLRHDEYVESMVEQAHQDTIRERAAFETKLRDAAEANAKVKKQLEDERAVHARVEQDLAEATRKLERDARELERGANETESLRAKLRETFAALDDAKLASRRAEARVADFETRVDGAEQSAAEARARSPVHRRNNERLAGELAKATATIEALEAAVAEAKAETARERRSRADEPGERRTGPSSPAADSRRSRGKNPEASADPADATAALEARLADVRAREDEIERAYAEIDKQAKAVAAARDEQEAHAATLAEASEAHEAHLREQSRVAVERASEAAAQAAAQYDAAIAKREKAVETAEARLSERRAALEREAERMAEALRRADADAAAAKLELEGVASRRESLEAFAERVNARAADLGVKGVAAPAAEKKTEAGPSSVSPAAAKPAGPASARKRKAPEASPAEAAAAATQPRPGRKSLSAQVMSAFGFFGLGAEEDEEAASEARASPSAKKRRMTPAKTKATREPKDASPATTPLALKRIQSPPRAKTPLAVKRIVPSPPKRASTRKAPAARAAPPSEPRAEKKNAAKAEPGEPAETLRARRTRTPAAKETAREAETPARGARSDRLEAIQATAEKPSTAKRPHTVRGGRESLVGRLRKTPLPAGKTAGDAEKTPASAAKKTTTAKKPPAKAKEAMAPTRRSTRASLARSSLA